MNGSQKFAVLMVAVICGVIVTYYRFQQSTPPQTVPLDPTASLPTEAQLAAADGVWDPSLAAAGGEATILTPAELAAIAAHASQSDQAQRTTETMRGTAQPILLRRTVTAPAEADVPTLMLGGPPRDLSGSFELTRDAVGEPRGDDYPAYPGYQLSVTTPVAAVASPQPATPGEAPTHPFPVSDVASSPAPAASRTPAPAPRPAQAPQAPAPVVAAAPAQPTTYTIRPNDTLSEISTRVYRTQRHWRAILDANPGLDPRRLRAGQVIRLPQIAQAAPSTSASRPAIAASATAAAGTRTHTIRSGDSLSSIAKRYYGAAHQWQAIFEANRGVLNNDPDRLKTGVVLTIPPQP